MTDCKSPAAAAAEKEYLVPPESTFELEPFIHQVGGRSAILVLGGYICKPVNARELAFYETLDRWGPQLKPFVPHYNGVIAVNFAENNDGYLMITTKSSSLHCQGDSQNQSSPGTTTAAAAANNNNNNSLTANSSSSSSVNQIISTSSNACLAQSPSSPYQKFVTKYRIKLCRPLREIIIESHEQDVENDVALDLESSKRQLEHLLLSRTNAAASASAASASSGGGAVGSFERSYSVGGIGAGSSSVGVMSTPTVMSSTASIGNLSRSRSTSISIPNFEDGNFFNQTDLSTLFDNPLFAFTTTTSTTTSTSTSTTTTTTTSTSSTSAATEAGQNGVNGFGSAGGHHHHKSKNHSNKSSSSPPLPPSPPPPPSFSRSQSSVASSPSRAKNSSSSSSLYNSSNSNKSTTKHNPWVLKTMSALSEFSDSMKEQRFIMLENLVANFEYPCIIDLKMGTRLHDDNATETKKQSHESKVNETTSGALGLRITGIQIYDKSLDRFICYNKYYGRKLTPEGFRASLRQFVSTENFVAHRLLERLIGRLQALRAVITQLDTFRFYTSSLLLIYEGNTCSSSSMQQASSAEDADGGGSSSSTGGGDHQQHCHHHQHDHLDLDKLIDVRVIDFAHSTHQHIDGSSLPPVSSSDTTTTTTTTTSATSNDDDCTSSSSSTCSQPKQQQQQQQQHDYDEGFVFGLDNLIKIFTMFKNESKDA